MNTHEITKIPYLFNGLSGENLPEHFVQSVKSFIQLEQLYLSAAREVVTKLDNLNDEFRFIHARNPIHSIQKRIKTPASIISKLKRRGKPLSYESARKNLSDIAGVRVICSYVDDVYHVAQLLCSQNDVEMIRKSDYIRHPKSNGYRSLHLIVRIPVFLSSGKELVAVEIQIRTIAMDYWASLDHQLAYKLDPERKDLLTRELKECADQIAAIDKRMQNLHKTFVRM